MKRLARTHIKKTHLAITYAAKTEASTNTISSKKSFFNRGIVATVFTICLAACGGSGSSDSAKNNAIDSNSNTTQSEVPFDYQTLIDSAIVYNVPGIVLRVETPTDVFLGSAGVSDAETQEAMQTYHQQPTASSGKPMIGLLTAMLADEGILNLDDTLEVWLDEDILDRIENSREMTLRQLLNHSAGVFNFVDDDGYVELLLAEPERFKSAMDFLPIAYDKPATFLPGEGYSYSNTGYLLTSLVLDKVLGEHHSVALRERILNPLALNSTYYRGKEKELGDFIQGYHIQDGERYLTKAHHENIATANDPVVSSVEDMGLFLKALTTNTSVINEGVRASVLTGNSLVNVSTNEQYGLGISVERYQGYTAYGHSGLNYGYRTTNIYVEELDLTITAFMNCSTDPVCTDAMDMVINSIVAEHL